MERVPPGVSISGLPHSFIEQQPDNLHPDVEKLIRAYAESKARGNTKKEKKLVTEYLKNPSFVNAMTDFKKHGAGTLASRGIDLGNIIDDPKKPEGPFNDFIFKNPLPSANQVFPPKDSPK